jgi:hypothetical protein
MTDPNMTQPNMADPNAVDQIVKDSSGRELGTIHKLAFGRFRAYDRLGTELGTYDPSTDKTYDRLGLEIGSGNQLHWLISQAWQG